MASTVSSASESCSPGRLYVLSGPSGSGKSTLASRALAALVPGVRLSVSATTRSPRPGERDGVDYYFLSHEEFTARRDEGQFLEWAEVHGRLYGTPAAPVLESLRAGQSVLLEIDVQGALQVAAKFPEAILIFVDVPSMEILESRLRGRGTDDEATVQRRLEAARAELELAARYHFRVVNDDLDRAVDRLTTLLRGSSQENRHPCTKN